MELTVTNWKTIREREFPSFSKALHLKAAGGSPMCVSAFDECSRYLKEMTYEGDLYFSTYIEKVDRARTQIAQYINGSADEIAFTTNSSTSATMMAELLVRANVERVYYPAFEFPTSIHALLNRNLELVPLGDLTDNTSSAHWLDQLEKHYVAHPRKRSAFVASHVSFLNGATLDIPAAAGLCAQHHMLFAVNATQSFGALEIDVAQPIDILFATGLKWACAGYGAGFLYLRQPFVDQYGLPGATGWLSVDDPYRMNNLNSTARVCARSLDAGGGMPHFPSLLALHGALSMFEHIGDGKIRIGVNRVQKRIYKLATKLQLGLFKQGFEILGATLDPHPSGIVSVVSPEADALFDHLSEASILISKRHHPVTGKINILRFGIHFYNTSDDIETLLQALGRPE